MSAFEVDAKLLEQFNALGTSDKEELIKQLKSIVGGSISHDSCVFLLELSGWNVQKAVGAFYDYEFGTSQPTSGLNQLMISSTVSGHPSEQVEMQTVNNFDARICPSSSGAPATPEYFKINLSIAKLATRLGNSMSLAWLPLGSDDQILLPPLPPGQFVELTIQVHIPTLGSFTSHGSLVGALSFHSPNGERFGEVLYCTAVPDLFNQTWLFHRGVPEEPHLFDGDTVMDEM